MVIHSEEKDKAGESKTWLSSGMKHDALTINNNSVIKHLLV